MREKILDEAQSLVEKRGLNAVSFQDLADATGLKKPSLFHYFRNKDVLALALMDRCQTSYGARYAEVLEREISAPEKLREIVRMFDEGLKSNRPCLLGSLSSDSATLSPELASQLRQTAESSIGNYAKVFEQGRREGSLRFAGEPQAAAAAFLSMLQGLQVLARAKQDDSALASAAAVFIDSVSAGSK